MLLYVILLLKIAIAYSILMPIPLEDPHPINSHELVCHFGLPIKDSTSNSRYQFKAQIPSQTIHETEGYLCSKTIWESKCEEGFFGGTTNTYIIHKTPVTDSECLEAYKSMKSGDEIPTPHFPPEYCSWMNTNSKSDTYITLKRHNVFRDPYQNSFADLVFLNHRCHNRICQTHYDNIKWITGEEWKNMCTSWSNVEGYMVLDSSHNLDISYVESEFIPRTPLSKVCYGVSYCGITGYALDNGLFFSPLSISNSNMNFNRDIPVKTCPVDKEISILPLSSSMMSVELATLEILFNTKCNDVVSKIRNGQNVTSYELGFLNPTYPGVGYSFINIKGRLLSSKSKFEPVSKYQIIGKDNMSVKYITKKNTYETIQIDNCTWISLSNGSIVCRWYNGFLITPDQIVPPYSTREELSIESDLYSEIVPNFDKHIVLPDIENDTIHTSDQVVDPDYKNPDIIGSIESWALKWFHYLSMAALGIMVLFILYYCRSCIFYCFKICCTCCLSKPKKELPTVYYNAHKNIASIKSNKIKREGGDFSF